MTEPRPHHRAKLTADQVREIRRILAEERVSYAALAARFGVSEPTISQIANYQTWCSRMEPKSPDRIPESGGEGTDGDSTSG